MTNWKGRPVLVTGADGFIGSRLTEKLLGAGARVRALALYNSFDSAGWLDTINQTDTLDIVRGDIRDAAFVHRLMQGQDIVLHLAALISIPHSYAVAHSYVDTNIVGTLNVLEGARIHGPSRVVVTSTSEVYGTAQYEPIDERHPLHGQSPYSASKIGADAMAEAYARSHEVPVVILRPFNTYGPRQSERAIIPTILRQALDPACVEIRLGDLTPRRDFTFVDDTAAAFMAAGTAVGMAYGEPFNAGSGKSITIGDLVSTILRSLNINKPVIESAERLRPSASEVRALIADSSKFSNATGWSPAVSLPEGIHRTAAWWRERLEKGKARAATNYLA